MKLQMLWFNGDELCDITEATNLEQVWQESAMRHYNYWQENKKHCPITRYIVKKNGVTVHDSNEGGYGHDLIVN